MNLLGFMGTKSLGDVALVGAGVSMAAGAALFAGYMLTQPDHAPRINGMEYLAIFAKPHGPPVGSSHPMVIDAPAPATQAAPTPVASASPAPAASAAIVPVAAPIANAPRVGGDGLDMAPTGSIPHPAATGSATSDGFRILAIEPGVAWLTNGAEIRAIRIGDVAPGLGRVASIEKRDGRWALIDDSGAPMLMGESPQKKGSDPFSRRMIFGTGD
ncbi:MAG TPA: hypothetical protein VGH40_17680 [Roseiarcus sp.]|jgi:hypothetical protein